MQARVKAYIVYIRVSTAKQGRSGLGLEAQQEAVNSFVALHGGRIVSTFREVESGKRNDRPALSKALQACKHSRATLLIAKLDRLSRNAGFLFGLRDSGVHFIAADMPELNTLTLGVMASLAQYEREMISGRTIAALQAAKARGVRLGNPNGLDGIDARTLERGRKAGAKSTRNKALEHAESLRSVLEDMSGLSASAMAIELNSQGILSARGGSWHGRQVLRVLERLDA